ncbi:Glucan 1,3-beta-glucosidase 3 [Tulasnella sp. 419]|nr:Glucan 1,3-beta-glucosidase 3 [Tulasnella sp. 419]
MDYWNAKGGNYEFWRFEDGYSIGWDDAYMFCSTPGPAISELGFRNQWIRRRLNEHEQEKGSSGLRWEFEHGFNEGYDAGVAFFIP